MLSTGVRSLRGSDPLPVSVDPSGGGSSCRATTRSIRRRSISATRNSHPAASSTSPTTGMCPNPSNRNPPRVTYPPSGRSMPIRSPDLVDARPAVDQPAGGVDADHGGLIVGVEFALQVADQGSQQVFHRQDPLDTAVLVDHHGEGPTLAGAFRPARRGPVQDSGTRNGWRSRREMATGSGTSRSSGPSDPGVPAAVDLPPRPEEVVHEEDANQVVEVVAVGPGSCAGPESRTARADVLGRTRGWTGDHVEPRGHDLADRGVPQVLRASTMERSWALAPRTGVGPTGIAPSPSGRGPPRAPFRT